MSIDTKPTNIKSLFIGAVLSFSHQVGAMEQFSCPDTQIDDRIGVLKEKTKSKISQKLTSIENDYGYRIIFVSMDDGEDFGLDSTDELAQSIYKNCDIFSKNEKNILLLYTEAVPRIHIESSHDREDNFPADVVKKMSKESYKECKRKVNCRMDNVVDQMDDTLYYNNINYLKIAKTAFLGIIFSVGCFLYGRRKYENQSKIGAVYQRIAKTVGDYDTAKNTYPEWFYVHYMKKHEPYVQGLKKISKNEVGEIMDDAVRKNNFNNELFNFYKLMKEWGAIISGFEGEIGKYETVYREILQKYNDILTGIRAEGYQIDSMDTSTIEPSNKTPPEIIDSYKEKISLLEKYIFKIQKQKETFAVLPNHMQGLIQKYKTYKGELGKKGQTIDAHLEEKISTLSSEFDKYFSEKNISKIERIVNDILNQFNSLGIK